MSVPEQPRVTTRSLAAELGLSRTTISRALRDDRRVADATRERVLRAARKKGYRADAVFSALAANRWRGLPDGVRSTLGLLNLNHSPLKSETVESGTETARSLGYGLDIVNLADYPDQQAAFRVFRAWGMRSVLLWMPSDQDFELEADVSNFIVLAAPIGMKQLPVHTVSSNHYRASHSCTECVPSS